MKVTRKPLGQPPENSSPDGVKYIPHQFLCFALKICSKFTLNKAVYSHQSKHLWKLLVMLLDTSPSK